MTPRFLVLVLSLTLGLPAPAWALRQTGLEESNARTDLENSLRPSAAGLEETLAKLNQEMTLFSEQAEKQLQRFHGARLGALREYEKQKEQHLESIRGVPFREWPELVKDEELEQLSILKHGLDLDYLVENIREGKAGNALDWLAKITLSNLSRYRRYVYSRWSEDGDPLAFEKAMQIPPETARDYLEWLRELDETLRGFYTKLFPLAVAIGGHRHLYISHDDDEYTVADLLKDLTQPDSARQLKAMELLPHYHKLANISRYYLGTAMPEIFDHIAQRLLVLAEQDVQPEIKARAYASFHPFTETGDFVDRLQQALILAMHDLGRDLSPDVKDAAVALIDDVIPWTTRWNPRRQEVALRTGLFLLESPTESNSQVVAAGLFGGLSQRGMYSSQLFERVLRTVQRGRAPKPVVEDWDRPPEEPIVPFPAVQSVRFVVDRGVMQKLGFGDRSFERDEILVEDLAGLLLWLETERMAVPDERPSDGPLNTEPFALDLLSRIQEGKAQIQLQGNSEWSWSRRFPQEDVTVALTLAGLEEGTLPEPLKRRPLPNYEAMVQRERQIIREGRRRKPAGQAYWVGGNGVAGVGKSYFLDLLAERLRKEGFHVLRLNEDELGVREGSVRDAWKESDRSRWLDWSNWVRWEDIRSTFKEVHDAVREGTREIRLKRLYDRGSRTVRDAEKFTPIFPDTIVLYDGILLSDPEKYPPGTFDHFVLLDASYRTSMARQITRTEELGRQVGPVIEATDESFHPLWRNYVLRFHPERMAQSVYDLEDFNRPVQLIYSAGLEESTTVEQLVARYPRLLAPSSHEDLLDGTGGKEGPELLDHYKTLFESASYGFTTEQVAKLLAVLEEVETDLKKALPGLRPFDYIRMASEIDAAQGTYNPSFIRLDGESFSRKGLILPGGYLRLSNTALGIARQALRTPPAYIANFLFGNRSHAYTRLFAHFLRESTWRQAWSYVLAHQYGQLIWREWDAYKEIGAVNKWMGIAFAELLRQGSPNHPYLIIPPLPEKDAKSPEVREFLFWQWESNRKFQDANPIGNIIADAVALRLSSSRPDILKGLPLVHHLQVHQIRGDDERERKQWNDESTIVLEWGEPGGLAEDVLEQEMLDENVNLDGSLSLGWIAFLSDIAVRHAVAFYTGDDSYAWRLDALANRILGEMEESSRDVYGKAYDRVLDYYVSLLRDLRFRTSDTTAGLEEGGKWKNLNTARSLLEQWLYNIELDDLRSFAGFREPTDITDRLPPNFVESLKDTGHRWEALAIPLDALRESTLQEQYAVYIQEDLEGGEEVRERLRPLADAGKITFVDSPEEARLIIGDREMPAYLDKTLLAVDGWSVDRVTPELLKYLEDRQYLVPGQVIRLSIVSLRNLNDPLLIFV